MTGFRSDMTVIDDPIKDMQEAQSETIRETTIEWFSSVVLTRMSSLSQIIVIAGLFLAWLMGVNSFGGTLALGVILGFAGASFAIAAVVALLFAVAGALAIIDLRGVGMPKFYPATVDPAKSRGVTRVFAAILAATVYMVLRAPGVGVWPAAIVAALCIKHNVELVAIGIGHDVTRYYQRAVTITDAEQLAGNVLEAVLVGVGAGEPRRGARAVERLRHDAERVEDHADVEAREVEDLQDLRIGHQLLEVRRRNVVRRNLHHVGRAVARRELHDAEPVALGVEPHRFGVDRNSGAGVARQIGQIATVQANGHGDVLWFSEV